MNLSLIRLSILHALMIAMLTMSLTGCMQWMEKPISATARILNPKAAEKSIDTVADPRPRVELDKKRLYQLLVAELAGQRGQLDLALKNYLKLAKSTRDPEIIQRATQIAIFSQDNKALKKAANLWLEVMPDNIEPNKALAVAAIRDGQIEEAIQYLNKVMEQTPGTIDQKLWLASILIGNEPIEQVSEIINRLATDYPDNEEAIFTLAEIALKFNQLDQANSLYKQTLQLDPDNNTLALKYLNLLQRQKKYAEAIDWVEKKLAQQPNNFELSQAYAYLLSSTSRHEEAKEQFNTLISQMENNSMALYGLVLLHVQLKEWDDAKQHLLTLVEKQYQPDQIHYYLGKLSEEQKRFDEAIDWYKKVTGGKYQADAKLRIGIITAQQGAVDEALNLLQKITPRSAEERIILIRSQADILISAKLYNEAMETLNQAISENTHPDLLYARSMLATKIDRLDIAETDLREVITQQPNNAQALNALGYTLADKTTRYEEAHELIKKALELTPDDFYIIDSMGWVLYRLGKYDEALTYLHKAIQLKNDPVVAAHLGEVLWMVGDKEAAQDIWNKALEQTPDNSHLLEVIQRLMP